MFTFDQLASDPGPIESPVNAVKEELADNDISDLLRDNFGDLSYLNQESKPTDLKSSLSLLDEIFDDGPSQAEFKEKAVDIELPNVELQVEKVPEAVFVTDPEAERIKYLRSARFSTIPAYQKRAKDRAARKALRKAMRMEQAIQGDLAKEACTESQSSVNSNQSSLLNPDAVRAQSDLSTTSLDKDQSSLSLIINSNFSLLQAHQKRLQNSLSNNLGKQMQRGQRLQFQPDYKTYAPLGKVSKQLDFRSEPTKYLNTTQNTSSTISEKSDRLRSTSSLYSKLPCGSQFIKPESVSVPSSDLPSAFTSFNSEQDNTSVLLPSKISVSSTHKTPISATAETLYSNRPVLGKQVSSRPTQHVSGSKVQVSSQTFNLNLKQLQTLAASPNMSSFIRNVSRSDKEAPINTANHPTKILNSEHFSTSRALSNGTSRNSPTSVITHSSGSLKVGSSATPSKVPSDYNANNLVGTRPRICQVIKLASSSSRRVLVSQTPPTAPQSQCPGCQHIINQKSQEVLLCQDCGTFILS
jgi:hypothetical protein